MKRIMTVLLLIVGLLLPSVTTKAEDALNYSVRFSPATAVVGETVTMTIALKNYTEDAAKIRGLQIDVTGMDNNCIRYVEESGVSLIEDSHAASNTISGGDAKGYVRLVYANFNGTLEAPCEDVMRLTFQIQDGLQEAGSTTLDVSVKLVTEAGNVSLSGTHTVEYDTKPVYSVEIAWGDLAFVYTKGTWNTGSHRYEGGGWHSQAEGGDRITVKNVSGTSVAVSLAYETERTDINGSFDVAEMTMGVGTETTSTLTLSGEPKEELKETVIGQVTVTLE